MAGMGLDVNFVLQAASYVLLEKVLSTTLPGNFGAGVQTVAIVDPSLYVGAQIVVGNPGAVNQEVVTVTAITAANFTANFLNAHNAGETVRGATFPSGQVSQSVLASMSSGIAVVPLFTQAEMLGYVRDVQNDMLERIRPVYAVAQQNLTTNVPTYASPADSIRVERIGVSGVALWNLSQADIDLNVGEFTQGFPVNWFQDKVATSKYVLSPAPQINLNFDGTRIQSAGGNNVLKYYFDAGLSTNGVNYAISVLVKNQGQGAVTIGGNIAEGPTIQPGALQQVSFAVVGNGATNIQLRFEAANAGDALDLLVFNPIISANNGPNLIPPVNQNFTAWNMFGGSVVTLTQNVAEPDGTSGAQLFYSQKGTTLPAFTDALILPDIFWYGLKYGILATAYGKDGEMRDARRATICAKRYERVVAYGKKFMRSLQVEADFSKLARAGVS